MPLTGEIVLAVGVQHREGGGQRLVGLVVIDDDDLGTGCVGGRYRSLSRGAAIDCEDEARAVLGEAGERRRRRPIAFGEPVGDVGRSILPMGPQEALDQGD